MRLNVRFTESDTKLDVDFSSRNERIEANFGEITGLSSPELEAALSAKEAEINNAKEILVLINEGGIV